MRTIQYCLTLLLAVVSVILFSTTPARTADQEQATKVGKRGEVMFSTKTRIGDVTLDPGHYQLRHRKQDTDHFVQFTLMKGIHNPNEPGRPTDLVEAAKIKCRVEPLDQKVRKTTVYSREEDGARRVTRIFVAGENVTHLF